MRNNNGKLTRSRMYSIMDEGMSILAIFLANTSKGRVLGSNEET